MSTTPNINPPEEFTENQEYNNHKGFMWVLGCLFVGILSIVILVICWLVF